MSSSESSSASIATRYLAANGARLQLGSSLTLVRRLCALPHGDEKESTSLKNSVCCFSSSFETSTPGTGAVSTFFGSPGGGDPPCTLSAAMIAPVSCAFDSPLHDAP